MVQKGTLEKQEEVEEAKSSPSGIEREQTMSFVKQDTGNTERVISCVKIGIEHEN